MLVVFKDYLGTTRNSFPSLKYTFQLITLPELHLSSSYYINTISVLI